MIELRPANSGGYRAYWSNGAYVGDVYREVDGYYVWWPDATAGCYDQHFLCCMYEQIQSLNQKWDAKVRRELSGPSTGPITGRDYVQSDDTSPPF